MKHHDATLELPLDVTPTQIAEGFYHCEHCRHVVTPTHRQIVDAENAPGNHEGQIKCHRCHKWAVIWRVPQPERPRWSPTRPRPLPAVSADRSRELFKQMFETLGFTHP